MQALGESATGAGITLIKTVDEKRVVGSHWVKQKRRPISLQPERRLVFGCQNEVEGEVRRCLVFTGSHW
jgi:hypothetical protein